MSYRSFVLHTAATRHTRPHRGASAARRYSTSLNDLETAVASKTCAILTRDRSGTTVSIANKGRSQQSRWGCYPSPENRLGVACARLLLLSNHLAATCSRG